MRHTMTLLRRRIRRGSERGAIAIMMAISMLALIVVGGLVLDFGLVRVDRQVDKSAADAAVSGGLYGLASGDGSAHPYAGVCSAISYLQKNYSRFGSVDVGSGVWRDGAGTLKTVTCTGSDLTATCTPGNSSTWAQYKWNGTFQGAPLQVEIRGGYQLAGSGFSEETLPAVAADQDDSAQGCDQLAVIIRQNRKPGLGSLASSSDLVSVIRSVGRAYLGPGGDAPAMLLLKRGSTAATGCPALQVGSNAGSSWIKVYGARATSGRTQAGTIHSDHSGSGCANQVLYGKASNGIIAYAAPKTTDITQADPTKPGRITSVAGTNGVTPSDDLNNVYGTSVLNGTTGPKTAAAPRSLVSRAPVDGRYIGAVRSAVSSAQSNVFGFLTAANAAANGYSVATCSSGNVSTLPANLSTTHKLFVDCGTLKSLPSLVGLGTTTVVMNGSVNPTGILSLPDADHVYIFGGIPALDIGNTAGFSMHTNGNTTGTANGLGTCIDGNTSNKAVLFIKNGNLKQNGGFLQLCNTTAYLMGGQADGCVPTYTTYTPDAAPAPSPTPCSSAMGTGQLVQTGGSIDWTAPNKYDEMTLADGKPDPVKSPAWADPEGPEDLALWDESAGNNSSDKYQFTGGGGMHLQGVFMVPNADPINLSGNANFVLTNAQFVATSLALASNNTTLTMSVDPNAAVTIPRLTPLGMVR